MGPYLVMKKYDLEDRTIKFARNIRYFVSKLPKTITNTEDIKQIARSSGSVGANYLEANASLGDRDFMMRIKISRKEAKETVYWLRLLNVMTPEMEKLRQEYIQEGNEFIYIFTAILRKFRLNFPSKFRS